MKANSRVKSFIPVKNFKMIDGKQCMVKVGYDIKGSTYGFRVAEYDQKHLLIIDPLLASTFIGGPCFLMTVKAGQNGQIRIASQPGQPQMIQ